MLIISSQQLVAVVASERDGTRRPRPRPTALVAACVATQSNGGVWIGGGGASD